MTPQISVIVATYRRDQSLQKALHSLGEQTFKEFEIVLVDDNDDLAWHKTVLDLAEEFSRNYPQTPLRFIADHPNMGSAMARNRGIHAADGAYITFLDDDDEYLPDKLEKQLTAMRSTDADYCITDLMLYNESGKLIDKRVRSYLSDTDMRAAELLLCHLKYHMTGTDTMMFKKSYLLSIGGFDAINMGDEFYLMQKAILGQGKFCYLQGCSVKAYVHTGENGISSGQTKIEGENQLFLHKKKYFSEMDAKSRRYIIMRHHAVLAFAKLRMQKPIAALKDAFLSFCADPVECVKLCLERKI